MHSIGVRHIRGLLHLCCLRLLCALPRESLCLLLLLYPRSWRTGRGLEVHLRLERPSILLLGDERVCSRLLGRPPFQWVDIEEPMHKIDESLSIGHLYFSRQQSDSCEDISFLFYFLFLPNIPLSISFCFMPFLGMGYARIISGSLVC